MDNYDEELKMLELLEKNLQFIEFTSETALKIGMILIENAKNQGKRITIDISRNCHQLFHYAFQGTSPDNDQWLIRKSRVVNRFNRSSMFICTRLKSLNKTIEEIYCVSSLDYAPYGGAFPIIVKNVGVVGVIAVSGLTQEEDHQIVVDSIKEYLAI